VRSLVLLGGISVSSRFARWLSKITMRQMPKMHRDFADRCQGTCGAAKIISTYCTSSHDLLFSSLPRRTITSQYAILHNATELIVSTAIPYVCLFINLIELAWNGGGSSTGEDYWPFLTTRPRIRGHRTDERASWIMRKEHAKERREKVIRSQIRLRVWSACEQSYTTKSDITRRYRWKCKSKF
jgi:hypothetical protein